MRRKPVLLMMVLGLAVAAGVGAWLVGIRPERNGAADHLQRPLIAVVDREYPPFVFHEDGALVGFNIDLVDELSRRTGVQIIVQPVDWAEAIARLDDGRADMLVGISVTPERQKTIVFTQPLITLRSALFVRQDTFHIHHVEDIGTGTVSVQEKSIMAQLLHERLPQLRMREYPTEREALEAVVRGEADAFAGDYYVGKYYIRTLDLADRVKIMADEPVLGILGLYSIGVKKGNSSMLVLLDDAIDDAKAEGRLRRIEEKWFGERVGVARVNWRLVLAICSAIAAIIAALLLWNAALRRAVNARTQELLRAKTAAEEASRAKERFLAMLSHEMRTPLTPVLAVLSSIDPNADVPEELRRDLAMMRRHVELEARLVDDLLDLTRIVQGRMHLKRSQVDAHVVLHHAVAVVQPSVQEHGQQLILRLEAAEHTVRADPTRLQQVFWNLLNNAAKFTPAGGAITIATANPDPGRLAVIVSDTGKGIAPDRIEHIFDAFDQGGGSSGGRRIGGLGLGLTISRQIMKMHEGTLEAFSEGEGKGARFTATLPAISSPTEQAKLTPVPEQPARTQPLSATAPATLLLVEDDPATRSVLSRLLRKGGYTVTAAGSLQEALASEAAGRFDLVLSDIGLPDGSGLDLMRHIGSRYAGRAIALSGYGMDQDIANSKAAGFALHLTKPVDFQLLLKEIDRLLHP